MTEQESRAVLRLYGLAALGEAREEWPWWMAAEGVELELGKTCLPYMPDFHADAAAAVTLAEKMASTLEFSLKPKRGDGDVWLVSCGWGINGGFAGDSLGEALLAALVAGEG